MFLSSRHELFVLLGTFVGGLALGLVFDVFRIYRKNFKGASYLVWLQDMLMWAVMLAVVYITLFITNNAEVRWYEFAGFGSGMAVYMAVLSKWVVTVLSAIICVVKKVVSWMLLVLLYPVRLLGKILIPPAKFIVRSVKKLFKRIFYRQKSCFLRFYRVFKKI